MRMHFLSHTHRALGGSNSCSAKQRASRLRHSLCACEARGKTVKLTMPPATTCSRCRKIWPKVQPGWIWSHFCAASGTVWTTSHARRATFACSALAPPVEAAARFALHRAQAEAPSSPECALTRLSASSTTCEALSLKPNRCTASQSKYVTSCEQRYSC